MNIIFSEIYPLDFFFSHSHALSEHARVENDRELYEGVPNVDSGDGIQCQSIFTAPPHNQGHAQTLPYRKGTCMFKHT